MTGIMKLADQRPCENEERIITNTHAAIIDIRYTSCIAKEVIVLNRRKPNR